MTTVPDVLFRIGIDELFVDDEARKVYKRSKEKSVGDFLTNNPAAREAWKSYNLTREERCMGRLTLETLEEDEPWFQGVAAQPEVFRYLVSWFARFGKSNVEVATDKITYFVRRKIDAVDGGEGDVEGETE